MRGAIPLFQSDLVEKGAMLHDIGRGTSHTILHAQQGADLLRAGVSARRLPVLLNVIRVQDLRLMNVTLLRLSPRDCMPQTTEEKIVTHADNLIEGRKTGEY